MPPGTSSRTQSDLLLEAHEDRVQRLEDQVPELLAAAATTNMQLVNMDKKIDSIVLSAQKIAAASEGVSTRLQVLEEDKKRWQFIKDTVRKIATPFFVIGGVLIGKFGETIWTWLSR